MNKTLESAVGPTVKLLRQVLPAEWELPPTLQDRWLLIAILAHTTGDTRMKGVALQALQELQALEDPSCSRHRTLQGALRALRRQQAGASKQGGYVEDRVCQCLDWIPED